jgi:hypothetical protein
MATKGGEHTGPRSGKNAPKSSVAKKGKPKMSQAAWDKLSSKQRDKDYGGSRFMQVGSRDTQRGGGPDR